jgi:hypothetical protein
MKQMDCCTGMNTATMGWMMEGMWIIGIPWWDSTEWLRVHHHRPQNVSVSI